MFAFKYDQLHQEPILTQKFSSEEKNVKYKSNDFVESVEKCSY